MFGRLVQTRCPSCGRMLYSTACDGELMMTCGTCWVRRGPGMLESWTETDGDLGGRWVVVPEGTMLVMAVRNAAEKRQE